MAIGVVVVGNLSTQTGVSHMNRLLLKSLSVGKFPVLKVPLDDRVRAAEAVAGLESFRRTHEHVLCIASHTVDRLPLLADFLQRDELRDSHRIALWHWEYEFPADDFTRSQHLFDEFWAVSHHAGVALRNVGGLTVRDFPVPIPVREPPRPTTMTLGSPGRFTFLVTFDHLSLSQRKNPQAAISAFRAAFHHLNDGGPQLIVKSRSAAELPQSHAELTAEIGDRPDISIYDENLSDEQQSDLIAAADVLVSLHRAEGYGLALAEALGAGTVAMGTAWSGNLDFMTTHNSVLVPYRLTSVPEGLWTTPADAHWAQPDVDAAAQAMKRLVAEEAWCSTLRDRALHDVRERHSFSQTAAWLDRVFSQACV